MKQRGLGLLIGVATVTILGYVAWVGDRLSPLFVAIAAAALVFHYRVGRVESLTGALADIVLLVGTTSALFVVAAGLHWLLIVALVAATALVTRLPGRLRAAHREHWDGDIVIADPSEAPAWNSPDHLLLQREGFDDVTAYSHSSPAMNEMVALLMAHQEDGIYAEILEPDSTGGYGLATAYPAGWLTTGKIKLIPIRDHELVQTFPDESLATLLHHHRAAMSLLADHGLEPEPVSQEVYFQRVTDEVEHVRRVFQTTPTRSTLAIERSERTGEWLAVGPITQREDLAARIERMRG